MKKLLTFIAAFVLSMCLLIFVGCGKTLAVPEKIRIGNRQMRVTFAPILGAETGKFGKRFRRYGKFTMEIYVFN